MVAVPAATYAMLPLASTVTTPVLLEVQVTVGEVWLVLTAAVMLPPAVPPAGAVLHAIVGVVQEIMGVVLKYNALGELPS